MPREKERISVTLTPTQKERLDELCGEDGEFDSRSAVVRYLIEQYDTLSEQGENVEDDSPREQPASYSVTFDTGQVIPDDAGVLSRLKWRFFGIPASAYAEAITELRAGMSEHEREGGAAPITIEGRTVPPVEETDGDGTDE